MVMPNSLAVSGVRSTQSPDKATCNVKFSSGHILSSRHFSVPAELLCHFQDGSWALILLGGCLCALAGQGLPASIRNLLDYIEP